MKNPYKRAWWRNWVQTGLRELQIWWAEEDARGLPQIKSGQWTALRIRWAARHACRRLRRERDYARAERDALVEQVARYELAIRNREADLALAGVGTDRDSDCVR